MTKVKTNEESLKRETRASGAGHKGYSLTLACVSNMYLELCAPYWYRFRFLILEYGCAPKSLHFKPIFRKFNSVPGHSVLETFPEVPALTSIEEQPSAIQLLKTCRQYLTRQKLEKQLVKLSKTVKRKKKDRQLRG